MESLTTTPCRLHPLNLSFHRHLLSSPKPLSSVPFTSPRINLLSIRASTSSTPQAPKSSKKSIIETLNPFSSPLIKTTCISIAVSVLFFARVHNKPTIAAPITETSSTLDSTTKSTEEVLVEQQEQIIEQKLARNPDDVETLQSLLETRIKSRKVPEAVEVINRLIELEPFEPEWTLLKAQIYISSGDFARANNVFEEILVEDPLRFDAYHGLLSSYSEAGFKVNDLQKRIEAAMEKCKAEKKDKDFREFKLLLAQINLMKGSPSEALRAYKELVKEEPSDFRPYLCQSIVYSLLNNNEAADEQFEKFQKLVPANHPFREASVDDLIATKMFGQKVERE